MTEEQARTAPTPMSAVANEAETAARLRARLEDVFSRIARERMAGLPMVNERVRVEAFGFERLDNWHVGVMLTPWFMNLMLLPAEDAPAAHAMIGAIGDTQRMTLPAGRVDCIVGGEEGIGRWLACSLFSPVFEFADHAAAAETARAALRALLTPEGSDPAEAATPEADERDDAAKLEQAFASGFARAAAGTQRQRLAGEAAAESERARARRALEQERRAAQQRAQEEAAKREKERLAAGEGVDLQRRFLLFGRARG